jgi:hypothetical protein
MNALVDIDAYYWDLREQGKVRYAYIDYNLSLALSRDVDIRTVSVPRIKTIQHRSMGLDDGPCNPFTDDVRSLAHILERSIRVSFSVPLQTALGTKGSFLRSTLRMQYRRSALTLRSWSEGKTEACPQRLRL